MRRVFLWLARPPSLAVKRKRADIQNADLTNLFDALFEAGLSGTSNTRQACRIETRHSPHTSSTGLAFGEASKLSANGILKHLFVEAQSGYFLPQLGVLVPEPLQAPHLGRQQAVLFLLPVEIGRLADPSFPANIRNRHARQRNASIWTLSGRPKTSNLHLLSVPRCSTSSTNLGLGSAGNSSLLRKRTINQSTAYLMAPKCVRDERCLNKQQLPRDRIHR